MKIKLMVGLAFVLIGCSTSRSAETVLAGYPWVRFNGKQLLYRNEVWDVQSGKQIRQFDVPPQMTFSNGAAKGYGYVEAVAFSPDGRTVFTATAQFLGPEMLGPGPVQLWDIASGRKLLEFKSDKLIENAQFLPDGKRILTTVNDGNFPIQIWNAKNGQPLLALPDRPVSPYSGALASISPDGRLIATQGSAGIEGRYYGIINIRDSIRSRKLCTITDTTNTWFQSAQFSPDGKSLLTDECILSRDSQGRTAGSENLTTIWDVKTGHRIRDFFGIQPRFLTLLTHDGRNLICYRTNGIVLLNLKSGKEIRRFTIPKSFPAPDSGVWTPDKMMLSPEGKRLVVQYLASTSAGTRIIVTLWNTDTGEFIEHSSPGNEMVWETIIGFAPKGEKFMLFNSNGKPELFDGYTGERLKVLENFQQR